MTVSSIRSESASASKQVDDVPSYLFSVGVDYQATQSVWVNGRSATTRTNKHERQVRRRGFGEPTRRISAGEIYDGRCLRDDPVQSLQCVCLCGGALAVLSIALGRTAVAFRDASLQEHLWSSRVLVKAYICNVVGARDVATHSAEGSLLALLHLGSRHRPQPRRPMAALLGDVTTPSRSKL